MTQSCSNRVPQIVVSAEELFRVPRKLVELGLVRCGYGSAEEAVAPGLVLASWQTLRNLSLDRQNRLALDEAALPAEGGAARKT